MIEIKDDKGPDHGQDHKACEHCKAVAVTVAGLCDDCHEELGGEG